MSFNIEETRKVVFEYYTKAKEKSGIINKSFSERAEAISDVIPGYSANQMDFGDYLKDNFSPLFIDIRDSTHRAVNMDPKYTFISMHAFFPGVCNVIEQHGGYVIDFMGDGVMALFGGKMSKTSNYNSSQQAGLCGLHLLEVVNTVINPLLDKDKIWNFSCGVGVDHGPVVVTKIGTDNSFDVKAFGVCINNANKLSKAINKVIVSKGVKNLWPSSEGGKLRFNPFGIGESTGYELLKPV